MMTLRIHLTVHGQNNEQKIVYIDSGSYVYEKGDNVDSYFRFHFIVFKQYNSVKKKNYTHRRKKIVFTISSIVCNEANDVFSQREYFFYQN